MTAQNKDQLHGTIYFGPNDFESIYLAYDHPLKAVSDKIDGYHLDYFNEWYLGNRMICSYVDGVLNGPIEVFNDDGYLIISGNFSQGLMTDDWEIFHPAQDLEWSYKSKWQANKFVSGDYPFFDAGDFMDEDEPWDCDGGHIPQPRWEGDTFQVSHTIWGYWSNYSDPVDTFRVTYKIQDTRILERVIVQHPFWGEKETTIATETFDENGALKNVELHDVIHKHNAYVHPFMFKGWTGYDHDNNAEVVLVRTIDLLEAREVKGSYKKEFEGIYDTSFGYGYKRNSTTKNLHEMYYFAWGAKYGVSMHFGNDNQVKMLKWAGKEVIWDKEKGIIFKYNRSQRKNIKDILKKGEPPFYK